MEMGDCRMQMAECLNHFGLPPQVLDEIYPVQESETFPMHSVEQSICVTTWVLMLETTVEGRR